MSLVYLNLHSVCNFCLNLPLVYFEHSILNVLVISIFVLVSFRFIGESWCKNKWMMFFWYVDGITSASSVHSVTLLVTRALPV